MNGEIVSLLRRAAAFSDVRIWLGDLEERGVFSRCAGVSHGGGGRSPASGAASARPSPGTTTMLHHPAAGSRAVILKKAVEPRSL